MNRINISIDSLQADRFQRISRVGKLDRFWPESMRRLRRVRSHQAELVVMKGYNEDEVLALTDFALARHVDIAFIEEMPLGEAVRSRQRRYHLQ